MPGGSKKAVYAALAANLTIALAKFVAAGLTGNIARDVPRNRAHAVMDELDDSIKRADRRLKRVFIESQTELR